MKKIISSLSLTAVVFLLLPNVSFAQKKEKDKVLANKTYTVEITATGTKKSKTENDEISFKGEKLNSKYMATVHRFSPAAYKVTAVDSAANYVEITFEAESKNPDGEELKITGTVTDEALEATAVITKKGKVKTEYMISGTLKEKKAGKK